MSSLTFSEFESFQKESIYLNYASTSFPKSKIALESFLNAACAFPSDARHLAGYLDGIRERIGKILKTSGNHIFFTHSATLGLNQVIQGYVKKDSYVVADNRSHNAVLKTLYSLENFCRSSIADIYDIEDTFSESALIEMLSDHPDLICLTHVSNVSGAIYPISKIIDLIHSHSHKTAILIDASQSVGAVSLACLANADFVVFPSHKHLHSLPGTAVLMAKKCLDPIIFGGSGSLAQNSHSPSGEFFQESGTLNLPAIQAMVDSLEFAESELGRHRKLENDLVKQFMEVIHHLDGIEVIHVAPERIGIVALKTKFGSPELHWAPYLKSQKIFVRGGLQCSPLHHKQLGLAASGSLRFSFGWETTSEHIDKALMALRDFNKIAPQFFK